MNSISELYRIISMPNKGKLLITNSHALKAHFYSIESIHQGDRAI